MLWSDGIIFAPKLHGERNYFLRSETWGPPCGLLLGFGRRLKMSLECLETIIPGEIITLRGDVLKHLKTREYLYEKMEIDNTIFILHKSGSFGLHVKIEDIDWEAYQNRQPIREGRAKASF